MHRKRYSVAAGVLAALLAIAGGALAGRLGITRAQEQVTVAVGDIWYCDPSAKGGECDTDIYVGDTVTWDFSGATLPHSTTACGDSCDSPNGSPLWDSGIISDGSSFSYTFTTPGNYAYWCQVHSFQRGKITVHEGARPPTPTLAVISPPVDNLSETPTPTTAVEELPHSGQGSSGGASDLPAVSLLALGGAALFIAAGALALRVRKSPS